MENLAIILVLALVTWRVAAALYRKNAEEKRFEHKYGVKAMSEKVLTDAVSGLQNGQREHTRMLSSVMDEIGVDRDHITKIMAIIKDRDEVLHEMETRINELETRQTHLLSFVTMIKPAIETIMEAGDQPDS